MDDEKDQNLPFNRDCGKIYKTGIEGNFKNIVVQVDNKNSIVFRWLILPNNPQLYISHNHCAGRIIIKNIEGYGIICCRECNFREEFPLSLKTVTDFKKYFEEKLNNNNKISRFKIMDI